MANLYNSFGELVLVGTDSIENQSVTYHKLAEGVQDGVFVTPEMFGAVGDGVADDTQAVRSAVNHGGLVLLNNTYRCTSSISITQSNVIIDGHGTIIGDFATDGSVIGRYLNDTAVVNDHIQIRNITIRSSQTGFHTGIIFSHRRDSGDVFTDITIDGVKVIDVTGDGIGLEGGLPNTNTIRPFFKVRNCRIINAGRIGICQSRVSSIIENNYVENSVEENITVDNGCENVVVSGNTCVRQRGGVGAIGVDEAHQIVITNNHLISPLQSAKDTEYNCGVGCQCNTGPVTGLVVAGNVFVNGKYGVKLGNVNSGYKAGGVFTNNIFESVGTDQFYLKNASEVIRDNNMSIA